MTNLNISQTTASDLTNKLDDWEVNHRVTDAIGEQDETTYSNPNWSRYLGYFKSVPDIHSAIMLKAQWLVGQGFETDSRTKVLLNFIKGWGKDTFQSIMFNLELCKRIGGDAFAEIVRDPEGGTIINLKPLDPGSMQVVVNRQGIIKRYEQIQKLPRKHQRHPRKFEPHEILHLTNGARIADEIHGQSDIEALEDGIKADRENFFDTKKFMHRLVKPMIMFKLGTDDQSAVSAFVAKMDDATSKGENIYIPDDENAVSFEVIELPPNATINALPWRDTLRDDFYRNIGLPQIIPGGGDNSTESHSKVVLLAFEQIVKAEQKMIEDQLWKQLHLRIKPIFPTSIGDQLTQDAQKDANQGLEFQRGDVTAGVAR